MCQEQRTFRVRSSNSQNMRTFRQRMLITAGVLTAIIVPVFGFLAWDYSTCPSAVIVPAGTVLSISPGQYNSYNFTVSKVIWGPDRPVEGAMTADNGITMFVLTSSQYNEFSTAGPSSSYVWSSGQVSSATYVSCVRGCPSNPPGAPIGTDYFVFYNPSTSAASKVNVNQAFVLESC